MKLPGHDTLRLILTQKAILVEGPSDELIVQKAFLDKYGKSALESRVDIISVQSLAFKRFLEIGRLLNLDIRVVTDNDGDVNRLAEKYKDYLGNADTPKIKICYDGDERYKTLEPQLLKANSLQLLNQIFGTSFVDDIELLDYMSKNKTDCALQIFNSSLLFNYPRYIIDSTLDK